MRRFGLVATWMLLGCSENSGAEFVKDAAGSGGVLHDASSVVSTSTGHGDSGSLDSATSPNDGGRSDASDAGGETHSDAVLKKMRECGILSREGKYNPQQQTFYYDSCTARCLVAAPCEEMKINLCATGLGNPMLSICLGKCENEYVTCPETLRGGKRCDGIKNCLDGADEAGCEFFTCKNGQRVRDTQHCDGEPNCTDGSDELSCFGTIPCADGSEPLAIPALECNGSAECRDGSDEIDCMKRGLVFACDDQLLPISMVCNLEVDCADGTDEAQGCATLDCGS